jgi:sugar phosphate isomerase/epimerase
MAKGAVVLSCTSFSFPLLRLPAAARVIAALGIAAIDLCVADGDRDVRAAEVEADPVGAAARDRRVCASAGLAPVDVFCHLGSSAFDRPVNTPEPGLRAANRRRLRAYLAYAHEVGAAGLTISPGVAAPGDDEGAFRRACDELGRYVGWATELGLRASVEPHLESVAASPSAARRLVGAVPGLRLTLDYSHFIAAGVQPEAVDPLIPLAGHVHARQAVPGRLQASGAEGTIPFDRVVRLLAAHGYRGAIALEYIWSPQWEMNRIDVVTETVLLRDRLAAALEAIDP